MMKREVIAQKKFLAVPVFHSALKQKKLKVFTVFDGEKLLYEFRIPCKEIMNEPDYFAFLPIHMVTGKKLVINADMPLDFFDRLYQSDREVLLRDKKPALHYTAPYGWLNDPNGLVYENGTYHLYYQHNPMDTDWENMSWGHAVSKDLVHFKYCSDVMFPDSYGTVYSGCAVLNERGCFQLPRTAILYFYTAAGGRGDQSSRQAFTQRMAYSLDHGRTLIKYDGFRMAHMEGENRDPKIFRHEESGAYIMVLYLSESRFGIFRSKDLKSWEETDIFSCPPMWECPDLFQVTGENGMKKWAFMSADGFYCLGSFDGRKFIPETEMRCLYQSKYPYAAQSFSGVGSRVLSIAWLRLEQKGKNHKGAMSAVRELFLAKDQTGFYIKQVFAKEYASYCVQAGGVVIIEDEEIRESISLDGKEYQVEEKGI